ncbi:PilZ domain-containing protein [Desulfonema magnum]|nr:PilZ domain-containing protein [Desulfonema magnum]
MDVSKYKDINKAVAIEHFCKCGHYSKVLLERRKFQRSQINIPGIYTLNEGNKKIRGAMTVKDLSRAGLKFELDVERDIRAGDRMFAEFHLTDVIVKKEVFIRKISGRTVGSEFCSRDTESETDRTYDRAITRYILHTELAWL